MSDKRSRFLNLALTVAVVVVIGAIVFPVLQRAKEGSSTCASNLKELARALNAYAGDYDGMLPSSAIQSPEPTESQMRFFETTWTRPGCPCLISPYVREDRDAQSSAERKSCKDAFRCPADPAWTPFRAISYSYKRAVNRAAMEGIPVEDFAYPESQVLIYERRAWHERGDPLWQDGLKINVAFVDGHVSGIIISDCSARGEMDFFNYESKTGETGEGSWWDPRVCSDKLQRTDPLRR